MTLEEYRDKLHENIAIAASANSTNIEEEFIKNYTDILISGEEFDDFTECYFEGVSRKKANMQIDGYAIDEMDGSCCIFISEYRGPFEDKTIISDEIKKLFNKIRYFVEESIKNELHKELEESTLGYEFSKYLKDEFVRISKFRFYVLTDAYNRQKVKNLKDSKIADKTVELNVWDIARIFDIVSSKVQKESIEIDFSEIGYKGIPCVKAVDYENVIADIDTITDYVDLDSARDSSGNLITYSSYLAVIPGYILNELYLQYGSRLLEGNVRSFLSVRGKVNKSIQNTIKNYPEMFFAYNNGIAATATEIETVLMEDGLKISRIKDLQIVNGGQTTASITNTLLTAKKDENIDISNLFVPMKISVLEHKMSEKIIPKISEYSNSQNKVDASDFFSNHPFHIRIEEYSRKIPAPTVKGNQYQQYWFYERARGQYNQGKMKLKPKSSQMKQYDMRYPESQVIKMIDLAKYMEIYNCEPYIVSRGKQALVKVFSQNIKAQWEKSNEKFNIYYFKRAIALAIIFKRTDEIIKNTVWYKEKRSYKANVIAYTISVLFDFIRKNKKNYEMDFLKIWSMQDIYPELKNQISVLCGEIYEFITGPRETENVTEWCKKELCWTRAQKYNWTILDEFLDSLVLNNEIKMEEKEAKNERKIENEIAAIKIILNLGQEYWDKVYAWAGSRKILSEMENSLILMAVNINRTGKIPSDKQAKIILKTRDRLLSEGMPIQI
jgi:hypothetical protein